MIDLDIDSSAPWSVQVSGQSVQLTPNEFKVVAALINHPGCVLNRFDLAKSAFGADYHRQERIIDTYIKNIRMKIEPDRKSPRYIQAIYGVGYQLRER